MKVIHRIVGSALAGAGLALALTSVAAAQPAPADAGTDPGFGCEGSMHEWSRGAWSYRLGEAGSWSRGESETRVPEGGACEFGSATGPEGWGEFKLLK